MQSRKAMRSPAYDTMGPNYFSKFNKYVQLFYSLLGYLRLVFLVSKQTVLTR